MPPFPNERGTCGGPNGCSFFQGPSETMEGESLLRGDGDLDMVKSTVVEMEVFLGRTPGEGDD